MESDALLCPHQMLHDHVLTGNIKPGDVVSSVNSCHVENEADWIRCLDELHLSGQGGYCVSQQLMAEVPSLALNQSILSEDGSKECCDKDSLSDICFQLVFRGHHPSVYKCLRARTVTARRTCANARECTGVSEHACVFPTLSFPSKLLRISHSAVAAKMFSFWATQEP